MIAEDLFKASRLAVDKNNVRLEGEDSDLSKGLPATPYYNNSVLEDGRMVAHLMALHEQLNGCPAMLDALLLLKVWMRQRELDESEDGLNGFLLAMLMAHLAQPSIRKVSKSMSSYQIFKVTLDFLAKGSLLKKGVSLVRACLSSQEGRLSTLSRSLSLFPCSSCLSFHSSLSFLALRLSLALSLPTYALLALSLSSSFSLLFFSLCLP